jgi:hypothetical protein
VVDNIGAGLREMGWGAMDWIDLVRYRDQCKSLVINSVKNLGIP